MLQTRILRALLISSLLVPFACAPSVATTGPQTVQQVNPMAVRGPYIPAGTWVSARANEALDTMLTPAGRSFSFRVTAPLRSADGTVVVRSGALLRGDLASVGSESNPRLRIALNSIDTAFGSARISAAVRHAQRNEYAGPTEDYGLADDGFFYPGDASGWGWWGPVGGGPAAEGYSPTEIRIPRGASIQFVLTRPLIPPGTVVNR